MKRVAVIWFGEVPVSDLDKTYSICLNHESYSGKFISDVELIDTERVTEETLDSGLKVITIKPKPEPQETVDDVVELLIGSAETMDVYETFELVYRLKEAKEREGK